MTCCVVVPCFITDSTTERDMVGLHQCIVGPHHSPILAPRSQACGMRPVIMPAPVACRASWIFLDDKRTALAQIGGV
ncbi:hypothetical protein TNCV_3907621 [Trichonephila clavipes]|nr:hypothetical protein TNCV_3907621 [Trichonephila clavipes]